MKLLAKITKGPSKALFPIPAVLVTSVLEGYRPNIITVAWAGMMNSEPPVLYVGVNPKARHSYKLIKGSGEYVINIPSVDQAQLVDYCGLVSGKNVDKFTATGLTMAPATHVKAPLIAECPVNIECKVRQEVTLDSHVVFIADILAVHYDEEVLDEKGNPVLEKIRPYAYCLNEYRVIGEKLGTIGYSKQKKS